eukprot:349651-Chlamydomonas_euryale.AAC.5
MVAWVRARVTALHGPAAQIGASALRPSLRGGPAGRPPPRAADPTAGPPASPATAHQPQQPQEVVRGLRLVARPHRAITNWEPSITYPCQPSFPSPLAAKDGRSSSRILQKYCRIPSADHLPTTIFLPPADHLPTIC